LLQLRGKAPYKLLSKMECIPQYGILLVEFYKYNFSQRKQNLK
jgi:hypothetical protein